MRHSAPRAGTCSTDRARSDRVSNPERDDDGISDWRPPLGPGGTGRPGDDERVLAAPWVRDLVRYLDYAITIPGTKIGIGIDALIGFFAPVMGDWLGAFASLVLLGQALDRRVPPVIILRMLLNVAIDTLLGMIPVAGDLFDIAFQANRRNLELLERHAREGKPRPIDYVVIGFAALLVVALAALPVVVAVLVLGAITRD